VDRENHIILVLGFSEDVDRTAVILRNIIDENVEIEETIMLDKHTMVGCIIGHGGQHIRSLQKEFNVQMRTDGTNHRGTTGSTATTQNVEKYNNSTEQEKLIIRGTSTRVSSAVNRVNELVTNYSVRDMCSQNTRPSVLDRTWDSVMTELVGHYRAVSSGLSFAYQGVAS